MCLLLPKNPTLLLDHLPLVRHFSLILLAPARDQTPPPVLLDLVKEPTLFLILLVPVRDLLQHDLLRHYLLQLARLTDLTRHHYLARLAPVW